MKEEYIKFIKGNQIAYLREIYMEDPITYKMKWKLALVNERNEHIYFNIWNLNQSKKAIEELESIGYKRVEKE